MYYALKNGTTVPAEKLRWVKKQDNGVFINCAESEGQGIILDGEIYHVSGRTEIDKPTVDLVWEDDVTSLKEENELLKGCVMELADILFGEEVVV